jgi:hypothetical protein
MMKALVNLVMAVAVVVVAAVWVSGVMDIAAHGITMP